MWVTGMLTTLPLLVLAVWRWASTEERIARRAEALADAATTGLSRRRAEAQVERRPARRRVTVTATTSAPCVVEHPVRAAGERGEQRRGHWPAP